jgi:acetoin utilization deacetylase AcuC-like enzyme
MDEIAYYYPEGHQKHLEYGHPERPERIEVIVESLKEEGHWSKYLHVLPSAVPAEVLENVHSSAYLNVLQMTCRRGSHLDADTYTTPDSWDIAINTAGGAITVARSVWSRQSRRGFALTRPPGHHATRGQGMGFCLLNNIAIAAEYLVQKVGVKRIAIIDLDLHHGNGTQDIFWRRGDIFYMSTHQSPLYPGSGFIDEVGVGEGEGTTANFPLPPKSGDEAFKTIVGQLIIPLLDRFQPEIILVSYGFDTHWSDPLGHLLLSASGYGGIIRQLTSWADINCDGKIALFLEGGYSLEAASSCSRAVLITGMLGEQFNDPLGSSPYPEGMIWRSTYERARKIWEL